MNLSLKLFMHGWPISISGERPLMTQQAKRFRIEAMDAAKDEVPAFDTAAVLAAIADLKATLGARQPNAPEMAADYQRQSAEVSVLKQELDAIQDAIADTKRELASLQVGDRGRELARLTDELDAVLKATETAADTLLHAAERIDQHAADLQASIKKPAENQLVADIRDQVVTIFEACNFQDLTGQRISKVVDTLGFVEERVERMMSMWVGVNARGAGPVVIDTGEEDEQDALLNGPKLEGDDGHVSQNDIDALFE